jgi:ABC-2 type transport system ATP-binding protein
MSKLGKKVVEIVLDAPLGALPPALADVPLELKDEGRVLVVHVAAGTPGIGALLARLAGLGIGIADVSSHESSLEDIFVSLVHAG